MAKAHDYLCMRLLIVGDGGVGKTALLHRFCVDVPCSQLHLIATIGIDFKIRIIELDGKTVNLQIWDTAGTPRFLSITTSYFRGVHGFMLVYDVTNQPSFDSVCGTGQMTSWSSRIARLARHPNVPVMLVGTKCDVADRRKVSTTQGATLAARNGWMFAEVSSDAAPGDTCVTKAFTDFASHIKAGADLVAASACGDCVTVARLLVANADPNSRSALRGGDTALHLAAANGHGSVARLLVHAGANPLARSAAGKTPLELAPQSVCNVIQVAERWVHRRSLTLAHHRCAFSIQKKHGFDAENASML